MHRDRSQRAAGPTTAEGIAAMVIPIPPGIETGTGAEIVTGAETVTGIGMPANRVMTTMMIGLVTATK